MISELRQAAARANGARSRGPKTAEGKRRSSQNGRRHNLYTRNLPPDDASVAEFAQILDDLMAEFRPETPVSLDAVRTMATAAWNKRRLIAAETALLAAEIARQAALHPAESPFDIFYRAFPVLTDLFGRLDARWTRQVLRARAVLRREEAIMRKRTNGPRAKTSKMNERTNPRTPACLPKTSKMSLVGEICG